MSSSNLVRLAVIKESVYGVTPGSGNFNTSRFTSEKLSGSPGTVESNQIRTDRMSSGQVVTSLTVGGDVAFELAKESALEDYMASAMYSAWVSKTLITADITIAATAKTLTRGTGSWTADGIVVGDFADLSGFTNSENNTTVMVAEVVSATVIRYVGPTGMLDEAGSGTGFKRADKLTIGTTKSSFSIEKAFLDLTNKAIIYRGMIASGMEINVAFGALVTGNFTFSGNSYDTADLSTEFITHSRTLNAAATSDTLNGSVDMPFLATSAGGTLDDTTIEVQSIDMKLNNNLNAQNVIGDIAPRDYSAGTAGIEISMSAYSNDASWDQLAAKLDQTPFAIGFMVKNAGGWYGFFLPAVQVSFDDPASGGKNQDIILAMKGVAKVGANGESALSLYRSA